MVTAITVQLDDADRKALEARALRRGVSLQEEAESVIHSAVRVDNAGGNDIHVNRERVGLGTALAEIWEGFELPAEYEIQELHFTGFDRDPFPEK
jgi:hypothetical protein